MGGLATAGVVVACVAFVLGVVAIVIGARLWRQLPAKNGTVDRHNTVGDKDLEALRIIYGFWLIIAGVILSVVIAVFSLSFFRGELTNVSTGDVVAVITAVTGVIGTLIAAFFGIQAAGAGRSQALSALSQLQAQAAGTAVPYKIDPAYGPVAGNTRVSITGNGLAGATAANFGTTPGVNFVVSNDGLIAVTSPPAPPGSFSVDVTVIFPTTAVPNVKVGTFYYYKLDKTTAKTGDTVTIGGAGFTGAIAIEFGNVQGTAFKFVDDTLVQANVPSGLTPNTDVDVNVVYAVAATTNRVIVGSVHIT